MGININKPADRLQGFTFCGIALESEICAGVGEYLAVLSVCVSGSLQKQRQVARKLTDGL